ncbi:MULTISPECIES: transporter substrate-binding domain-containing protein [Pseudomonas]|jgi:glutamate/aspartate transport system substrate-binding protein|uniref:Transporter substrate-binding domain-containing protein n=1 Tax=Pseudomonas kielensis TaxID=2762577 RepID=A0A7X1KXY1_9PSED|nr:MULTISPECIES: transporter substrate-binding domain-containing protein [Pseudomonas]MBC2690865.1 transporter substrate-binding domain-containing protein [Pseudomonas kielensis]NBB34542.1 transporter substrate-binding domain-containing protein [Pseudomonas sp. BC115LW]UZM15844.1 transporter substrate-binding domain-containing protein [Pseudomonas kielensis]WKL51953.1 transporter substrate-binding domain-containing protein [Pseudomonas kielensis]
MLDKKKQLLALVVAACLGTSVAQADDLTGTLKKIKESGTVTLGYRDASLPFSYLNDAQQPIGYSIELCQKIVDQIKVKVGEPGLKTEYVSVVAATRTPLLINGTIDLECGVTTNTVERQKQIGFLLTSYVASAKYAVKKTAGINSVADLKGKAVVVITGGSGEWITKNLNREKQLGLKILNAKDGGEAFLMLETGRAVAYINDDVQLMATIAQSRSPDAYTLLPEPMSAEPYAIGIRKNDPQFKSFADDVLRNLYSTGVIDAQYPKWFEQPIPPKNAVINLPMSEALKQAIAHPNDTGV